MLAYHIAMNNAIVSRGALEVSITPKGHITAQLGGKTIGSYISKLAKPINHAAGEIVATLDGNVALFASELAAIESAQRAARAEFRSTPRGQREALTTALANCERGSFPGSVAWRRESAALKALADFDSAHPEVIAALSTEAREQVGEASLEGIQ